ncbi:hypothetical protein H2198_006671 [Neophaeococcomyces mojaviensis]|uniref:Uncharacterized protein n=1 Tax=Neophaeococcomyces mojaviensis TaxID=3383035 RepID=A0ACC3A2A4_9EURO|nr:hypothetical protein H2198_006671 [Knufia sp. JES_112]
MSHTLQQIFSSLVVGSLLATHVSSWPVNSYVNWHNFHATGVNLGGWLVQEPNIDPYWWGVHGGTPDMDEWTWCKNLGDQCGPVLEERYATYITTDFIDKLASVGTTIIRVPTTYAAWVQVPGSELYTGKQTSYLKQVATHAIEKYGMHVMIDLHSLPGGTNFLTIGEATGHIGWYNSSENLAYSLQAVHKVIDFIQSSGHPNHYTLEPINEPMDNIAALFTPNALTPSGRAWVKQYFDLVIEHVAAVNPKIPVALQTFLTEEDWSPQFDASANIVFDQHIYYFENDTVGSANLSSAICADAQRYSGDGKFPVFIGEWAIQTGVDNVLALREHNLQNAQYAWNKYAHGSAMWTGRHFGNVSVDGEGLQGDYWSYEKFIDLGYVKPVEELECSCS